MWTRISAIHICVLLLVAVFSTSAHAGVLDFLGVTDDLEKIKERVIDDLLQDFEERAQDLIVEGENSGNALLIQAGNEAMMAIGGAEVVAGRNTRELLRSLDDQQEEVFARIEAALDRIEESRSDFVSLSDIVALDIEQLIEQLPFSDEAPFYMRRVDGLVIHPQPGPLGHKIRITGSRFGVEIAEASVSIALEIGGEDQGFESYSTGEPNTAELLIPQSWIDEQKQRDDISIVPVRLHATRTTKASGPRGYFGATDSISTTLKLRLVVLPDIAGRIRPIYSETAKVWIPNEPKSQRVSVLPGKKLSLQEAPGIVGGVAKLGDVRFVDGSARHTCVTDFRDAYSFPRKTLPATDPVFSNGWSSLKKNATCLEGQNAFGPAVPTGSVFGTPSSARLSVQVKKFEREFGVSRKKVYKWLSSYRTNPNGLCHVPPSQLKSWATRKNHDFSACPNVTVISAEPDAERTTVTFRFGGHGNREARYDVSAQFERYAYDPEANLVVETGEWQEVHYGVNEMSLRDSNGAATKLEFQPVWSPETLAFLESQIDRQEGFSGAADTSQGATKLLLFEYEFPQ
ncbi:hypothetical protein [uncultured Roseobacter sp.]|uniref:hypothetical protein n=1 Tax=uncultured Roseobacter sp. TaxID=114847 RepID=UPI00262E36E6|nr:hypothetical protein [uncultured Roseobacter sp.]